MPVYINPKISDCSSYDSTECAPGYLHGNFLSDEDDEFTFNRPEIHPEETEDYIEALARYEDHLKRMDESITIFEEVYWRRVQHNLKEMVVLWGGWLIEKLIGLGKEMAACLISGAIFMGALILVLAIFGPMRIRTLGVLLVTFVIGSIFLTESIEVAASSFIGVTMLLFLFFAKIATGSRVLTVKNRSLTTKLNEDYVHVFIDFWYCGDRSIWINLSEKIIGIL